MFDDRPEEAKRLQHAREKRGFKDAKEATRFFGWNYDTYIQHERGERGIKKAAEKYAVAYRVSAGWLLTGDGLPEGAHPAIEVPLISWVSAGEMAMADTIEQIEAHTMVQAPELPSGDWIALRVVGISMDRISPPDSIIFVNRRDKGLVANACYVIATEDGEATYKRYRPGPDRFEPVSSDKDLEAIYPDHMPTIIGRVHLTMLKLT